MGVKSIDLGTISSSPSGSMELYLSVSQIQLIGTDMQRNMRHILSVNAKELSLVQIASYEAHQSGKVS
ncbi:hypothetical protein ACTXT7_011335 [Hymenolepis weldensis]